MVRRPPADPGAPDEPGAPLTRAQRQEATRDALVQAAHRVFARDGYQGANLARIAREAGFSKGAVYSNFDGKAELFLAVMDQNLELAAGEDGWDPFHPLDLVERGEFAEAERLRGFALATLEFIAAAVRDEELADELVKRVQILLQAYERVAREHRAVDEQLPVEDVAALLAALDQGTSLLLVSGLLTIDGALMRTGLSRLVDPDRRSSPDGADDAAIATIGDRAEQRRLLRERTQQS